MSEEIGMEAVFGHHGFAWLRKRTRRRLLVVGYAVSLVAMLALAASTGRPSVWLAWLVPHTSVLLALAGSVHGILDLPVARLDERQVALRAEVHRRVYWPAALLALLGGVSVMAVREGAPVLAGAALVAVAATLVALPLLWLAWVMGDDVDGDD